MYNKPQINIIRSFIALLLLTGGYACNREEKSANPVAAETADLIQVAIDKNYVIYVFDSTEEMEEAADKGLALGGAYIKNVDTSSFYAKNLSAADYAQNFRTKSVEFKPDPSGMLFSRYDFGLGTSKLGLDDLRKAMLGDDVVIVPKKSGFFSSDYAEVRQLSEVDAKLTDVSWGGQANKSAKDLLEDLRPELDSPSNALNKTRELKVTVGEKVDPDLVIARLETEFGAKYAYKQIGPREIEIRPHDEMIALKVIDGQANQVINGMTGTNMQKALLQEDFIAPSNGVVLVLPSNARVDWAAVRKSGLYDTLTEVNDSVFSVRPGAFGRQKVGAVYLRRVGSLAAAADALDVLRKPEAVQAIAANPAIYGKVVNEGALALRPGVNWVRQPGFDDLPMRSGESVLGKGAYGKVEKVLIGDRRNAKFYAQKTMSVQNFRVSQEISNGIVLGELGIGPRIERAEVSGGQTVVTMEYLETDAKKTPMSRDQVLSYADKMLLTKKYGLLQLDDKPANILLDKVHGGVETKLNDFAFMQQVKDGVAPGLSRYGTYAAPESTLRNTSDIELADYKTDHTRSFFFGFNVLYSRMGKNFEKALVDSNAINIKADPPLRIDGDLAISGLQGKHAEAKMSPEAYNRLLDMMKNDYKARPSIDSFVKDFGKGSVQFEFVAP